jgi:hypothetical protein
MPTPTVTHVHGTRMNVWVYFADGVHLVGTPEGRAQLIALAEKAAGVDARFGADVSGSSVDKTASVALRLVEREQR